MVIHFSPHSSLRFREAEQWCSLGLRFLKHLDQQKPVYEEQVGENAFYTSSCRHFLKKKIIIFVFYSDDDCLY